MSSPGRKLVLIVDDTPTTVAVVSGVLKDSFRTKVATNGEKALAIANGADKPDLILLDVMMADMDGLEVCRRLKANPNTRDIPVIFLTAKSDAIDEAKGFEAGAADYIHKPFAAPVVLARVKSQLALQAALADSPDAVAQSYVSSEALAKVLDSLDPLILQPEEVLLRQGEESDAAFFLDSGLVQVYEETRYGPVVLATLRAPRLIGEIGALAGLRRTASIKALTPATLFRINRAQLFKLSRRAPELLMGVVRQLGQQIESVSQAVALYTNALAALERRELDSSILEDLANPPGQLAEFSVAFNRLANQIRTKQRQQEEMASAAMIQYSFLPKETALNAIDKSVEVHAQIRPTREVGGDFYDIFMLDQDRLAIVMGDVCGKGIPASIFMAVVVTVLRMAAREEPDPASAIARTNAILCRDNTASLFATTFYGVLNLRTGALDYCNCGHTEPVRLPASGPPIRLDATALPLALFDDRPAAAASTRLDPGDRLILFTDGVTEAANALNEEFGDERLIEAIVKSRNATTPELVTALFAAVDGFSEGAAQADDIACVAVTRV